MRIGSAELRGVESLCLGAAVGLISLPTSAFALGQALLLAGHRITALPAVVILALSLATSTALAWRTARSLIAPAVLLVVVMLATVLSAIVFDTSYDGQFYHFDAITALAQGWNPFLSPQPEPDIVQIVGPIDIWARHYPQGAWIFSALQVAAGAPSEATKGLALIALGALFLAVWGTASGFGLGPVASTVVSASAAVNPILLVQLFSRMNDGLLAACLALVATFSIWWILRPRWWAVVGVVCPLVLAVNLKFSAVPMAVGLCGLICLYALVLRGWRAMLAVAGALALAGTVGVVILGAHPYVTNTLRHGHPFYPLMGQGKVDIIANTQPLAFEGLSAPQRMLFSYFGATEVGLAGGERLKPPFAVYRSELLPIGQYDARIAAFGPLYSGALVLGVMLAAAALAQRPLPAPVRRLVLGALGILALALVMPQAWWARYVPYAWWIPVLVALAATVSRPRALRFGGMALFAVLLVNGLLVAGSSAVAIGRRNLHIRHQHAEIARQTEPVCLYVGAMHARLALWDDLPGTVRLRTRPLQGCALIPLAGANPDTSPGYCLCDEVRP